MAYPLVQNYTYDSLNRLSIAAETSNNAPTWKQSLKYDRFGNRNFDRPNTTMPASFANPAVTDPSINPNTNRITSTGFLYDATGNTTRDGAYHTYTYDAENKQIEVRNSSLAILGQYAYDGDGKRVKKHVPGTGETTIFVYDAAGTLVAEYSTIVQSGANAKVSYLTNDHLGSPRINTDQNGAVISRHDYHPFGEEIDGTGGRTTGLNYGDDTVRKQFTGYERDGEVNLDFAQARYYSNKHGRFTSVDPLNIIFEMDEGKDDAEQIQILLRYISDPQNWNRFVYVTNNPLKYIDPDGFERYDSSVTADEEEKLRAGLRDIAKNGNKQQRRIAQAMIDSNLLIRVTAATNIQNASGTAGLIDAGATNAAIRSSRLNETQALDHVVITVARETVDSGQRGITGTLVHEGRHAWHNAMAISSFSYADIRPNVFNPTYFQTEYGARETYATWAINSRKPDYIAEAVNMGVVVRKSGGGYSVSDQGIRRILASSAYGLTERNPGGTFSYRTGVGMRPTR